MMVLSDMHNKITIKSHCQLYLEEVLRYRPFEAESLRDEIIDRDCSISIVLVLL